MLMIHKIGLGIKNGLKRAQAAILAESNTKRIEIVHNCYLKISVKE